MPILWDAHAIEVENTLILVLWVTRQGKLSVINCSASWTCYNQSNLCWANWDRQFKGFLYPEQECNMKGQITEISCSQVHVAGAFRWNFLWHITISEFNTKHCLSINGINNWKGLIKKLWCENKNYPWSICCCLSVGGDVISVRLQHSS